MNYPDDIEHRLPFKPLWRQTFLRFDEPIWDAFWDTRNTKGGHERTGFTQALCADLLGVTVAVINGWKRSGVPLYDADTACTKLNLHPVLVFGDEWWTAIGVPLLPTKVGSEPDERWHLDRLTRMNEGRPDLAAQLLADVERIGS